MGTKMITKEILDALKIKYGSYEIPKKFVFISEPFTLQNGMLTQTMKLKRRPIATTWKAQLERLYQG